MHRQIDQAVSTCVMSVRIVWAAWWVAMEERERHSCVYMYICIINHYYTHIWARTTNTITHNHTHRMYNVCLRAHV